MRIANRIANLGTETAFAVGAEAGALAAQGSRIYPFHLGDINLPTPSTVVEGAAKAIADGKTGYCPNAGIPQLREAIAADMLARVDQVEATLGEVETRAPLRASEARERLRQRITQHLNGNEADPYRLEQEIVMQADRMDCTEECVRLRAHLKHFREFAADPAPAGRKFNFLLQEMNREANTIGAKAVSAEVSQQVVEIKDEVERLREQVQNIE